MRLGKTKVRWFYDGNETSCILGDTPETTIVGKVTRYVKDTNDKRVARKESFVRAMSNASLLPKDERRSIWNDFRLYIAGYFTYNCCFRSIS